MDAEWAVLSESLIFNIHFENKTIEDNFSIDESNSYLLHEHFMYFGNKYSYILEESVISV